MTFCFVLFYFIGLPCNAEQLPRDIAGGGFWPRLCQWSQRAQLKHALGTRRIHTCLRCHCQRHCAPSHPALHGNLSWTPLCVYTNAKIRWMFCYFKVSPDTLFPSLLYWNVWNLGSSPSPPPTLQKAGQATGSQQVKLNNPTEYSRVSWFVPAEVTAWGWSDPHLMCHTPVGTASQTNCNYSGRARFPQIALAVEVCPGTSTPSAAVEGNWAIPAKANGTGGTEWSRTASPARGSLPLLFNGLHHTQLLHTPSHPLLLGILSEKPPHYRQIWERGPLSLETHLTTDPKVTVGQRGQR